MDEFLELMGEVATVVSPSMSIEVIKGVPGDKGVVEAALEAAADCTVAGDRHLLDLARYEGIEILTPARFVATLAVGLT